MKRRGTPASAWFVGQSFTSASRRHDPELEKLLWAARNHFGDCECDSCRKLRAL